MLYHDLLSKLNSNETLQREYSDYLDIKKSIQFIKFIETLIENKKYTRRIYKKNNSENNKDNITRKIISLLNKITDKNYDNVETKIISLLNKNSSLNINIIDNILRICIKQIQFIKLYLKLLCNIYTDDSKLAIINTVLKDIEENIEKYNLKDNTKSEYLQLCERNKYIDEIVGWYILTTELEKQKLTNGRVDKNIHDIIEILKISDDYEVKYKYVQCLYSIFIVLFNKDCINNEYQKLLSDLIKNEKNSKIKFKLMDIIERR